MAIVTLHIANWLFLQHRALIPKLDALKMLNFLSIDAVFFAVMHMDYTTHAQIFHWPLHQPSITPASPLYCSPSAPASYPCTPGASSLDRCLTDPRFTLNRR